MIVKPLVQVRELTYKYHGANKAAIDGLNLDLNCGEWIALMGRNGSGKTTFARLLTGLIEPDKGTITSSANVKRIGMVLQNPENQIIGSTVLADVAFGLENSAVEPEAMMRRAIQALETVGLYEKRDLDPHNLSGGEKQKLTIAGELVMEPHLLILDEAMAMLDPKMRSELLVLYRDLVREKQITILMISNRLADVLLADRLLLVDKGQLVYDGKPLDILNEKLSEELLLELPDSIGFVQLLVKNGFADAGELL